MDYFEREENMGHSKGCTAMDDLLAGLEVLYSVRLRKGTPISSLSPKLVVAVNCLVTAFCLGLVIANSSRL